MGTHAIIKLKTDNDFGVYVHFDGDVLNSFVDNVATRLTKDYRDKRPDDFEYTRMRMVDAIIKESGGYDGFNYGLRTRDGNSRYLDEEEYVYQIAFNAEEDRFYNVTRDMW